MNSTIEKRDYQIAAVKAAVKTLKKNDRAQLHMAPGAGKTIVSLLIKEVINPTLTVFFAPTVQLIHQQRVAWENACSIPYQSLAIVSGSTPSSMTLRKTHPGHFPSGCTTDINRIERFVKSSGSRVMFCTYRSAPVLIEAMRNAGVAIDLAIFDEAHRVSGSFEKRGTLLLDEKNIRIRKRLFLTATPKVLRNNDDAIEMAGMNDSTLFGDVAYTLSFREAVERKILVDYQVMAAAVTEEDLKTIKITESRDEKIALAAISKAINTHGLKKGLTFHNSVADARRFSVLLRDVVSPDTYVDTLNTSHSAEHRAKVLLRAEKAKKCLISNVRILGEGIDFSALDYIVFVDPKNSPVEIIQNIGRVMRQHDNKETGIVIVPVMLNYTDDHQDCEIDSSRFSSVFRVASAIGSLDTMFANLLDNNGTRKIQAPLQEFMSNHIKVVGINLNDKKSIKRIEEKIKLFVVASSKREHNKEESIRKLKAFCETHNRLPSRLKPEELSLFNIASNYYQKNVSQEYKDRLKPIIEKYRTQKIDRNLPLDKQFGIFEAWVRKNRRLPYSGKGGSRQRLKEMFEANGMTMTDEELSMKQWINRASSQTLTPELKQRLAELKEWVSEVSPTTSQLVKKYELGSSASALKEKLHRLGVEPHFALPGKGSKTLWDIEKVKAVLDVHNSDP